MSLSYKHTEQDSKAKQRQDSVRPQSNHYYMDTHLLNQVELLQARIKTGDGKASSAQEKGTRGGLH